MTARRPLHKSYDGYRRAEKMVSRTSKTADSNTSLRTPDHTFCPLPQEKVDVDHQSVSIESVGSSCYRNITAEDAPSYEEQNCIDLERRASRTKGMTRRHTRASSSSSSTQDTPEQLAALLVNMMPGSHGEELGDAFLCAAELPPITKQSLSELDIQHIITNIKLRHDVNFDRDLSFRPNLDGAKGQEKMRASSKYWNALVAELELYARLFQGTPPLLNPGHPNWPEIVQHAQRRIPKMFETIREVLKSLVPDRDHARVDEHLDVSMLMQEIERGVCDLVRLAEWLAHLLKEHCAPMRDILVDQMVQCTQNGVAKNASKQIVKGLRELFGMLEAMKLDVANHQIRNLKTLLIEDTVNFERHYHLDRLVNGRARVNIETAHQWYEDALGRFRQLCMPPHRDAMRLHLEVFVRAVLWTLFANDSYYNFPDTFYLDQDRLRALKTEVEDMIYSDICFDMFGQVVKSFGYHGPIPTASKRAFRMSLSAIVGEGLAQGASQWIINSENISIELLRQALILTGYPQNYGFDLVQRTTQRLRTMFVNRFHNHALTLESCILPRVLFSVTRHTPSPPMDLFNHLVSPNSPAVTQVASPPCDPTRLDSLDTVPQSSERLNDLSNRITHIILLHWRIWGPIAYVMEEETQPMPTSDVTEESKHSTTSPPPPGRPPPPVQGTTNTTIVTPMKTGEPPDPGQEAIEHAGPSPSFQ